MNNPSIDHLRSQIQDHRTKEYFDEVLSCYYSGNYRSAVVMLYATVICDLVYKLEELESVYNDAGAAQILTTIKGMQTANPTSADWENKLPELCRDAQKVIGIPEYNNIDALHKLRHLCAHPVLTGKQELYRPNTETMLSHLVNMLEGVLTKAAFQTSKLFEMFLDDLDSSKTILVDDTKLKSYILAKYLNKMNSDDTEYSFFKSLWKLVFKLDNQQCQENRDINFRALLILAERHKEMFADRIAKERAYFGKNVELVADERLYCAIKLFNYYPRFFNELDEPFRLNATAFIDGVQDLKAISVFRAGNPVAHIFTEKSTLLTTAIYLSDYLRRVAGDSVALDYNVKYYGESANFNGGDLRFANCIAPYINDFSIGQLSEIVKATNGNSQLYGRRKAKEDNTMVYKRMSLLDPTFDFAQYQWFEHF